MVPTVEPMLSHIDCAVDMLTMGRVPPVGALGC